MMAEREQHLIPGARDPLAAARGAPARDDVDVLADTLAEGAERQAVDVVAERVLDPAADERDAQDDVGGEQRARDRHPPERLVQLERRQQDVDPCDLLDGDAVRDGQRRVEHALRARQHVVYGHGRVERLRLVDVPFERAVVVQRLQVGGEVC